VTSVDEWEIYPEHFWLHGKRPEKLVKFDEELKIWHIYGYPETVEVLTSPTVFSNDTGRLDPIKIDPAIWAGDFAQMDPPEHRKVRGLVDRAFSARTVVQRQSHVEKLINELLDELDGRDRFDLVNDFSLPLPVIVISELLGVPKSDREFIHDWMHRLLDGLGDFVSYETPTGESLKWQEKELEAALDLLREMRDYWSTLVVERRQQPREDLLTHLTQADIDGDRLSDTEIFNIANRLFIAGHHSTSILIGNTILCLDTFPEQAARIREDRSLIPTLIEESLRFISPISGIMRCTNADAEIGGTRIPKDQVLMAWTGAANRDPRKFDRPDKFDVARMPNPHLGFGRSIHICPGRALGRMESRTAINLLLDRFPELRVDPDQKPEFYQIADASGVCRLPVVTGDPLRAANTTDRRAFPTGGSR
jgi:cytochrome P450